MVKVKRSFVVKPQKPIPNTTVCLSDLDQEKPITHALTVYFYPPFSGSFSFTLASQALRKSLGQVLVHFYPLAGRLSHVPGSGGRVALECDGSGIAFHEAESDARIDDFALGSELGSFVPSIDYAASELHELPLLTVQLTELSCGGTALGIAVSNVIVDGTCASQFISEWARITRGDVLEHCPVLDRTVLLGADPLRPPRFKHNRFEPCPLMLCQSNSRVERDKSTTMVVLHLSKDRVETLKKVANSNRPTEVTRPFSRFEAVAGHMWRSASKARDHHLSQETKLSIQVSIRGRVPLPKWYFGNAVLKQTVLSQSGELMERPLSYACGRIREAVDIVTDEYVKSALDDIRQQPDLTRFRTSHTAGLNEGSFDGNPNMEILSWLGIQLEGIDFGWGKDVYMGPATINVDGKGFIMPGRKEDKSVSIVLRFQVEYVEKFKKCFYQFD